MAGNISPAIASAIERELADSIRGGAAVQYIATVQVNLGVALVQLANSASERDKCLPLYRRSEALLFEALANDPSNTVAGPNLQAVR